MKRVSSLALSFLVVAGLLFAAGCDSTGSDGTTGSVSLRMDGMSPGFRSTISTKSMTADSVDEAMVTITEVSVVTAEDTSEGDSTEVGVNALSDSNFTVDLKELQAGLDTALADTDVPTGRYSQVRLITADKVHVTFKDGSERDVMVASGQQTGFKVNFDPFTIESADDRVEVTLNWDVQETLRGTQQGQNVITPVIDATVDTSSSVGS